MSFFGHGYEREGAGLPMPEGGIRRYALLLTTHFWKLIGLNLLFVLFSLPIITMPAALCGMNRVCMLLIRNGHCFLWQDFIEEFKRSFVRSILPVVFFLFFDLLWLLRHELGTYQCRTASVEPDLLGSRHRQYHCGGLLGRVFLHAGFFVGSEQQGHFEKCLAAVHDPAAESTFGAWNRCGGSYGCSTVDANIHSIDYLSASCTGTILSLLLCS